MTDPADPEETTGTEDPGRKKGPGIISRVASLIGGGAKTETKTDTEEPKVSDDDGNPLTPPKDFFSEQRDKRDESINTGYDSEAEETARTNRAADTLEDRVHSAVPSLNTPEEKERRDRERRDRDAAADRAREDAREKELGESAERETADRERNAEAQRVVSEGRIPTAEEAHGRLEEAGVTQDASAQAAAAPQPKQSLSEQYPSLANLARVASLAGMMAVDSDPAGKAVDAFAGMRGMVRAMTSGSPMSAASQAVGGTMNIISDMSRGSERLAQRYGVALADPSSLESTLVGNIYTSEMNDLERAQQEVAQEASGYLSGMGMPVEEGGEPGKVDFANLTDIQLAQYGRFVSTATRDLLARIEEDASGARPFENESERRRAYHKLKAYTDMTSVLGSQVRTAKLSARERAKAIRAQRVYDRGQFSASQRLRSEQVRQRLQQEYDAAPKSQRIIWDNLGRKVQMNGDGIPVYKLGRSIKALEDAIAQGDLTDDERQECEQTLARFKGVAKERAEKAKAEDERLEREQYEALSPLDRVRVDTGLYGTKAMKRLDAMGVPYGKDLTGMLINRLEAEIDGMDRANGVAANMGDPQYRRLVNYYMACKQAYEAKRVIAALRNKTDAQLITLGKGDSDRLDAISRIETARRRAIEARPFADDVSDDDIMGPMMDADGNPIAWPGNARNGVDAEMAEVLQSTRDAFRLYGRTPEEKERKEKRKKKVEEPTVPPVETNVPPREPQDPKVRQKAKEMKDFDLPEDFYDDARFNRPPAKNKKQFNADMADFAQMYKNLIQDPGSEEYVDALSRYARKYMIQSNKGRMTPQHRMYDAIGINWADPAQRDAGTILFDAFGKPSHQNKIDTAVEPVSVAKLSTGSLDLAKAFLDRANWAYRKNDAEMGRYFQEIARYAAIQNLLYKSDLDTDIFKEVYDGFVSAQNSKDLDEPRLVDFETQWMTPSGMGGLYTGQIDLAETLMAAVRGQYDDATGPWKDDPRADAADVVDMILSIENEDGSMVFFDDDGNVRPEYRKGYVPPQEGEVHEEVYEEEPDLDKRIRASFEDGTTDPAELEQWLGKGSRENNIWEFNTRIKNAVVNELNNLSGQSGFSSNEISRIASLRSSEMPEAAAKYLERFGATNAAQRIRNMAAARNALAGDDVDVDGRYVPPGGNDDEQPGGDADEEARKKDREERLAKMQGELKNYATRGQDEQLLKEPMPTDEAGLKAYQSKVRDAYYRAKDVSDKIMHHLGSEEEFPDEWAKAKTMVDAFNKRADEINAALNAVSGEKKGKSKRGGKNDSGAVDPREQLINDIRDRWGMAGLAVTTKVSQSKKRKPQKSSEARFHEAMDLIAGTLGMDMEALRDADPKEVMLAFKRHLDENPDVAEDLKLHHGEVMRTINPWIVDRRKGEKKGRDKKKKEEEQSSDRDTVEGSDDFNEESGSTLLMIYQQTPDEYKKDFLEELSEEAYQRLMDVAAVRGVDVHKSVRTPSFRDLQGAYSDGGWDSMRRIR